MATADTIKQYFVNILQRDPTATELTTYTGSVDGGALTLTQVRDSLAGSLEAETYVDQVIRIYQAAFGRKPDITGIDGWVDQLRADPTALSKTAEGFVNSTEWKNRYGDNTVNPAVLQALYLNVLGRAGSGAEIDAWIKTGQSMTQILIGFSNSQEFITKSAAAVTAIKQAAGDVATSALNTVYTGSGALFDPAATTGQTFTLTTNLDALSGTAGNDTFIASGTTFNTGDTINGGAGTADRVNLIVADNAGAGTSVDATIVDTTGVEQFYVRNTDAASDATVNASGFAGATQLWNDRSTEGVIFSNVGTLATIGLNGVTGGATSTTVVQFAASALTGTSDTVNIALNGSSDAGTVRADNNTAAGGVETFALAATGTNKIAGLTAGTDAKTVNITGAGDLTITAAIANVKTIDGSASTGKLDVESAVADVNVKTGTGADKIELSHTSGVSAISSKVVVDAGAGNDTVTLTNIDALNEIQDGAKIGGGEGTDILAVDDAFAAALNAATTADVTKKGITGFETLRILSATTAADNINVARLSTGNTISTVDFAAAASATTTVSGLASGGTVELSVAGNGLAVEIAGAADAGANSDVANLVLNGTHVGANIDYGVASIANVETININSTSTLTTGLVAADTNEIDLTAANAQTINVSGNVKADLDGAALTAGSLQTINASANTAGVNVSVAAAVQGITITGTAKADTITGGNGADAIVSGAGDDIIVGGAGNDSIDISGGGSNNITLGSGKDTITGFNVGAVADGGDVVNLSALTKAAGTANLTPVSTTGAAALSDNNLFVVDLATDGKDYGGADFADLFGAGKAFATTDTAADAAINAFIVVRGATNTQIYLVDQSDGDAIDATDVTLIGVLNGVTNTSTFVAANFDLS